MAGPMRLRSWWEVAFLLVFVFVVGMSQVNPFLKHWGNAIVIGMFIVALIALLFGETRP
ncbi:MAG TPA: hypothetical protein VNJ12_10515 [Candidatus Dormibacteraeota bacterium]|nr:hypothetical protein [Candidatus Dormibacteraeota bacterium]